MKSYKTNQTSFIKSKIEPVCSQKKQQQKQQQQQKEKHVCQTHQASLPSINVKQVNTAQ